MLTARTRRDELCQGNGKQCFEVTTGLYLSPAEDIGPELLRRWLARGLGLESRTGLPPNAPISDPQRR